MEFDKYGHKGHTLVCRPVTRILCGGGANEAKADPTAEMYFLSSDPFI